MFLILFCGPWNVDRVSEYRVPRNTFGPKRDDVMGWLKKRYKEELRDLYSSPSTNRIIT
jgi:hypothetical protein